MKTLCVRFAYADYAIDESDAILLLVIASRMRKLTRKNYSGPYEFAPETEPFVESASLVDVVDPEPEEATADKFLDATRNLPPF